MAEVEKKLTPRERRRAAFEKQIGHKRTAPKGKVRKK